MTTGVGLLVRIKSSWIVTEKLNTKGIDWQSEMSMVILPYEVCRNLGSFQLITHSSLECEHHSHGPKWLLEFCQHIYFPRKKIGVKGWKKETTDKRYQLSFKEVFWKLPALIYHCPEPRSMATSICKGGWDSSLYFRQLCIQLEIRNSIAVQEGEARGLGVSASVSMWPKLGQV